MCICRMRSVLVTRRVRMLAPARRRCIGLEHSLDANVTDEKDRNASRSRSSFELLLCRALVCCIVPRLRKIAFEFQVGDPVTVIGVIGPHVMGCQVRVSIHGKGQGQVHNP